MSLKQSTIFLCSKCDTQFPKWFGQCPECGTWGSIAEALSSSAKEKEVVLPAGKTFKLDQVKQKDFQRIQIGFGGLDRVLGGGLVPGSLILLGGAPGIGKSTLVLQIAKQFKSQVLYVSGEESAQQIKLRLDRLEIKGDNLEFLGETDIGVVQATIKKKKPGLAIIDSIQTVYLPALDSEPGSVSQIRASTVKLLETAKKTNTAIIVIGHVTKEGTVAGPKTLEHLVDTVLYLEGDLFHCFRILKSVKNRFGSTNEVSIFEMKQEGLVEIMNPSEIFLSSQNEDISGSVITAVVEGTRSFLVEVQALVSRTVFGYPQRKCTGFDLNRLQLLIAVLSKRAKIDLSSQDVHVNVVGGLNLSHKPSVDLAVALAIISAYQNKPISKKTVVSGEIGLGGEVRPVSWANKRIKEAIKMGFQKIIAPKDKYLGKQAQEKVIQVKTIIQAIKEMN